VWTLEQQYQAQGAGNWPAAANYQINKSLRFRSSANTYLSRSPASNGNRKTWTYSVWLKRGALGGNITLLDAGRPNNPWTAFYFSDGDGVAGLNTLAFATTAGSQPGSHTNATFRDCSAWYHFVLAVDTTQATASNRVKIWVNNVLQTFSYTNYPSQNYDTYVNSTASHGIGALSNGGAGNWFDGYMTEINLIDGQALTPSSFGTTDAYGIWQPIAYSGTYGTNGFYLPFTNTTSTTTLGYDSSGNGNNWTTNNFSLTSGTTYDSMYDSPTNASSTVANYCTLNPIGQFKGTQTISNGNLQASQTSTSNYQQCFGTLGVSSGKWYWEWTPTTTLTYPTSNLSFGFIGASAAPTTGGSYVLSNSFSGNIDDGTVLYTYPGGASTSISMVAGDTIGLALDLDSGTLAIYVKNSLKATITGIPAGTYVPFIEMQGSQTNTVTCNFGQRGFLYTPPTGFLPLNTYNLPDSVVPVGNRVMDATLYTGTGAIQSIVNAAGFKPDFVWMKRRNGAGDNNLFDSVRGVYKDLYSNGTSAEATYTDSLTAFNSNGWSLGTDASGNYVNTSGQTMVGWQWQAGQGTTSSNTNGSITSTISANPTAGFSIVTWTGNGTLSTVGHGLGVAPSFIINKQRDGSTYSWNSYHVSLGNTYYIALNTTSAADNSVNLWNSTSPTSTVFTVNTQAAINPSGGTMVSYCFAPVAGYSAFGSYTGNGSTDGPFIYTGFRPKFVLFKVSTQSINWIIYDTARNTYNTMDLQLYPNLSNAETSGANLDILSNGFKIRSSGTGINSNTDTYIYAAFAENPFKMARAR
jgi:hypothetical protein